MVGRGLTRAGCASVLLGPAHTTHPPARPPTPAPCPGCSPGANHMKSRRDASGGRGGRGRREFPEGTSLDGSAFRGEQAVGSRGEQEQDGAPPTPPARRPAHPTPASPSPSPCGKAWPPPTRRARSGARPRARSRASTLNRASDAVCSFSFLSRPSLPFLAHALACIAGWGRWYDGWAAVAPTPTPRLPHAGPTTLVVNPCSPIPPVGHRRGRWRGRGGCRIRRRHQFL